MTTLRDQFVAALIARGETQVPSRSGKFLTFTRAAGGFYFIGRAGSLRFNPRSQSSTDSIPASDAFKAKLLAEPGKVATDLLSTLGL